MFASILLIPRSLRIALALTVNGSLLAAIGYAFWATEWVYLQPTARPSGLVQAPIGSRPHLPAALSPIRRTNRPLAINFLSSICPCTEFNLEHLRKLQQTFGATVDFVAILETEADATAARAEFRAMHLKMPVLYDPDRNIGASLGVYGTPQIAILDSQGRLFFRGNYNRTRYCTDESTEYARISLTALTKGRPPPPLPAEATITYGCPLPRRSSTRAATPALKGTTTP